MERAQFDLLNETGPQLASAALLESRAPRTLVYGYTCDRKTFHVYLDDSGCIHKLMYSYEGEILLHKQEADGLELDECVPDKRLYPEACDYEFCQLLRKAGVHLSFTTWSDTRVPAQYYGKCADELVSS